jgi:hypothetical protein
MRTKSRTTNPGGRCSHATARHGVDEQAAKLAAFRLAQDATARKRKTRAADGVACLPAMTRSAPHRPRRPPPDRWLQQAPAHEPWTWGRVSKCPKPKNQKTKAENSRRTKYALATPGVIDR